MYSQNDWRYYGSSLQHSWGMSPEQRARAREYNHQYWLENRERIMRQRAARAAGRDFEGELADVNSQLSEKGYENFRNRVAQDEEQRRINRQYSMDEVNRLNDSANAADRYNSDAADDLRARARGIERMNNFYSTKNMVDSRITNNRNYAERLALQNDRRRIQREYDEAVAAYKKTPIAKISNFVAGAIEKGKQAITDVINALAYADKRQLKR